MKGLALVGVLLMAPGGVAAQAPEDAEVPRISWGAPDLQGVWDFRTLTPLERPRNLEGKALFSEEEAAEFARRSIERRSSDGARDRSVHTVEDSTWWTRPWTAAISMKNTAQQVYEYACHEGNYGMFNILSGSRAEDRASEGVGDR